LKTRRVAVTLFGTMAGRTAWLVVAAGLLLLGASVLLQAGKQHRQFTDMRQQQLRQVAQQASQTLRARIGNAEVLMRSMANATSADESGHERLRGLLQQDAGFFGAVSILPGTTDTTFVQGSRRFELTAQEVEALSDGRSVLLSPKSSAGAGRLYLMRELEGPAPRSRVLAELRDGWWMLLTGWAGGTGLAVFDAAGQMHFSTRTTAPPVAQLSQARLAGLPEGANVGDIAWTEGGMSWTGAVAPIDVNIVASHAGLAMVALTPARPWSVAFWSAVRTQGTFVPLVLLAAWLAWLHVRRHELTLRQVSRALGKLPDRRISVHVSKRLPEEMQHLAEACNRVSEAIVRQNETRRVLDEIDALLLPGGDYESVLDQVLTRVRAATMAHNVGLTLIDPVSGHGRLFAVSGSGGQPVSRVMLDGDMVATLSEAEQGLTVARCEEGRHSFLEPLQGAGATFFWIWPVIASGEVTAVLAIGYAEAPSNGAVIAATGTQCAQRLGLSLASHARAERLYRQAHFDPLTQLPNRLLFRDQLHTQLQATTSQGGSGALLYIDLDHFKRVNDSLGHEAGDQLLSIVAQRLRASVKDGDTVARLGGDEFTVILRDITDTVEVAAVAQRIIEGMRRPVRIVGRDHVVRASIGIAMFPGDGTGIDELLHNADLAMYRAKELGRGGAEFYNVKLGLRSPDSGMFRALSRREFSLYFQPQYRVHDGSLAGVEALLRWQQPGGVLRTSAEFVPAAEESGLIVDLGGWVIEAACAQLAQWRDSGVDVPVLAVNLSVPQLRDTQLATVVRRHLERHRLEPASLTFEISEAALTDEDSLPRIRELSELGVGLTLDDFGTGNTSVANLRRHPVQAVKIDRSFVERLESDQDSAALASTIIVMARALGRKVIAEGVESAAQLDFLREQGCDMAQGYFLARPLSAQDMTSMLLGRQREPEQDYSVARR